jgi:hypothetical protein
MYSIFSDVDFGSVSIALNLYVYEITSGIAAKIVVWVRKRLALAYFL